MQRSSPSSGSEGQGAALVTLAVAAVGGAALVNLAPPAPVWAPALGALAVAAGLCALRRHPRDGRLWWVACGVMLGGLAGALAARAPEGDAPVPVRFSVEVRDGWTETVRGWRSRVRVERIEAGERSLRTAAHLDLVVGGATGLASLPPPGTRVTGSGELVARSPWALSRPMLRVKTALLLGDRTAGPLLDRLREDAMQAVQRAAGVEGTRIRAAGLAGALALGRTEALPKGELASLRRSGLAHILAVSGMNVGMVAAMAWGLLLAGGVPPRTRRWILLPVVVGFCLMAGADAPVRRATLALSAYLLARQLGRPLPALPTAWAVVAGLALVEPGALLEPGFLLSAVITLALLRWVRPLAASVSWLPKGLGQELAIVAVAQAASIPLVGAFFGTVPPLGMLVNLLASPLAFVLMAISLAIVVVAPLLPPVAGLGLALLAVLQHGLDLLAGLGSGAIWAFAPPPAALLLAAAALGVAALLPGRGAAPCAISCLALSAAWLFLPSPAVPGHEARLLRVGQGMALLVRSPDRALLVDTGRSPGEAARDLARLRVRRLDALVVTHPDDDHTGGARAVLDQVRVGALVLPAVISDRPEAVSLRRVAASEGVPVRPVGPGDALRVGSVGVEILWPPPDAGGSDNDASLVARITLGGVRILVTGDLEAAGELALVGSGADLRAEVLQLGHHGSRSSSTNEFLRAVGPVVTLAPTGTRPTFAYPHPEASRRVRALPAIVVGQRERDARLSWLGGDVVEIDTGHPVRVYTRGGGGGRD